MKKKIHMKQIKYRFLLRKTLGSLNTLSFPENWKWENFLKLIKSKEKFKENPLVNFHEISAKENSM